jgi:hypothetical protein
MGFSPFSAGDGSPWPPQAFTTDSGVYSLAGVANNALAMHMQDMNNNNALYICTGAWVIQGDGSTGKATFTPSVADVTTGSLGKPGQYKIYPVVTLSTGAKAMDAQIIQVVSLP